MTARGEIWIPTADELRSAADRIAGHIHETPLLTSQTVDTELGCRVSLKSEHLQKAGAFKARGAHNAVFSLSDDDASNGVLTHSSGNHGAALALAARSRGIPAHIVMPANAPQVKKAAVFGYGAEVTECQPTLEARETTVDSLQRSTRGYVVHAYDDRDVICGQSSVGLEIVDQLVHDPPDAVVVPVGGGGLLAGVATALSHLLPNCVVYGAEPTGADDAKRSFDRGLLIPQTAPDTIADGLLTSLGTLTFPLIQRSVEDILLVDDRQIVEAMQLLYTRTKQVVEPSGAVSVAAISAHRHLFEQAHVVAVLSGGNVDLAELPW